MQRVVIRPARKLLTRRSLCALVGACSRKRDLKAINVSTWAQAYRVFPCCATASAGQIHIIGRRGIEGAIDPQLQACAQCGLGQLLFGGPRSVPTNMSCSCPAGAGEINQLRDTGKFPREMESFLSSSLTWLTTPHSLAGYSQLYPQHHGLSAESERLGKVAHV